MSIDRSNFVFLLKTKIVIMRKFVYVLIVLVFMSCGSEESTTTLPQRKDITESVYSSVTIQPDSMYQVYAAITGILEKIFIEEGDEVQVNQPLFHISNKNVKLNSDNAKLGMQIAKEKYSGANPILEDLKNEIKLAQLKLQNDSTNFIRQQNLWKQKIGAKVDYDNKKLQYETAKQTLNTLINKYNRTASELKQQVEQATNNYESSLSQSNDFTIESKIDGRIYSIEKNIGELISIQQPIAMIGSKSVFIAELLVDEVDITKISIGQKVIISLDSYQNEAFEAIIHKIYPKKNERSQTFKIEAQFINKPKTLYPGLSGEGNIIIDTKANALVIPKTYLINGNSVKTDAGIVNVVTGLESLDMIEILSGISEKTILYFPEE